MKTRALVRAKNCLQVNGERKMYCESWADKKWLAMVERRSKREGALARARERDTSAQARLFTKAVIEDEDESDKENLMVEAEERDETFVAVEEQCDDENNEEQVKKRRRILNSEKKTKSLQDMPEDWQHLRHSIRKVREVYYHSRLAAAHHPDH